MVPQRNPDLEFSHLRDRSRFVVRSGETTIGRVDYVMKLGNAHVVHTEVDPAWRGQQIASLMTEFAIRELTAAGTRIIAECPFVIAYLKRHPMDSGT